MAFATSAQLATAASADNPVTSSSAVRADNNATGGDITGLTSSYAASNALLQQEQQNLADRNTQNINDIKTQSAIDEGAQKNTQDASYASRSTNLVTSGGGFLGATQSHEGVLQNLKNTFDTEHTALITKRDAAVNAAQSAYEDKNFALAKEQVQNAKDLQTQITSTKNTYADQQLKIAQENRAQATFDQTVKDQWNSLSAKYPSAGISQTDTLEQVNAKIRNSDEYKLDQKKAEADIANTNSIIQDRKNNNIANTTLSTRLLTPAEILQYQTDHIDAGIVMGDSQASAQAKINASKVVDTSGATINGLTVTLSNGSIWTAPNQAALNQFKKDNNLGGTSSLPSGESISEADPNNQTSGTAVSRAVQDSLNGFFTSL